MEYVLLVVGFVLLIKGADFFVEGSSSLAQILKVPSVVIGLTIVAMGTSAPEASVSINAALAGSNDIAISNVVGSNIFNLMVVCGACALFAPLTIKKDTLVNEFPLSIICSVLLIALGYLGMKLGHIDGMVFLILFAGYLDAATQMSESSGGGGSTPDGWGKDEDEDDLEWARRCARMASHMCRPAIKRGNRR